MLFFPILSAPLIAGVTGTLLLPYLKSGEIAETFADRRYRLIRFSIVRALIATVILYTLHLVLSWIVPYRYSPGGLFVFHLVTHHLVFLVAVPTVAWWYLRYFPDDSLERMFHLLFFLATSYLLAGAFDVVRYIGSWTAVTALLQPLLRTLAVVLVVPVLTIRPGKMIWGLPAVIIPASLATMWLEWFRPLAAVGMVLVIVASGAGGLLWYVFLNKGRDGS